MGQRRVSATLAVTATAHFVAEAFAVVAERILGIFSSSRDLPTSKGSGTFSGLIVAYATTAVSGRIPIGRPTE